MLKKVFASFSIVCLIFSASVHPCLADEASPQYTLSLTASVGDRDSSIDGYYFASYPSFDRWRLYSSSAPTFTRQPLTVKSGLYEPAAYDRTLIVALGIQNDTAGSDSWFNNVNNYADKPTVYYSDSRDSGIDMAGNKSYINGVDAANDVYQNFGAAGEIFNFRVTVPAYSNSFTFSTSGFVLFTTETSPWHVVSYGGYIIDTADSSVLGVIEQILTNTSNIDVNIANLVEAINQMLQTMRSINADTNTIVEVLGQLSELNSQQLARLELISSNVDAIYALLSKALETESDVVSQAAQDATVGIQDNANLEAEYQAAMQGSYDRLDLENFNLNFLSGSLQVVTTIFSDMWAAFGDYNIIFLFPLVLGVALLGIGRISRTGGGNSSRTSEHKGGEGGA